MISGGCMKAFITLWKRIFFWMNTVGEVALFLMMVLTVADVILRTFGHAIVGTYELVAMIGAIVVGGSLSQTSWDRGHVYVDMLIENRSPAIKNGFFIATRIVGIVLFAFLAYHVANKGICLKSHGDVSMTLRLPYWPFTYALAFCFFVQCFSLLTDIFRLFESEEPI
jgi:TRAP-type C4-dicarboxylate transport system permease small subunit